MTHYDIPFNKASLQGGELGFVADAIARGHISADGFYTQRCQELLEERLGVPRALLTTSCTHALEMAALLTGLAPGDEVLIPAFTFVSTANAFWLNGARPVFVDVRPDTLNLDERLLEGALTPATRAVAPVHYGGVGCDMEAVCAFAAKHDLMVIEDNAHGLLGRRAGRWLGTFGQMATLSFHETKNITCGEGGALLLNDESLIERAEILRQKGTDRSRFFRGEVDKYTWVDKGSSYALSDLLAAFLWAQLQGIDAVQERRAGIWRRYRERLADWAARCGATFQETPPDCESAHHLFCLLMPSLEARTRLIDHLKARGVFAVFHYQPLHLSAVGRRLGGREGDCPVTEDVCDRILRLPFYASLTDAEIDRVTAAMEDWL